jgi:Holliday junction resolvase
MGALSRNKGAGGERELARLLADELGAVVTRNLVQAREGGADLLGVDGWAVEVKRAAKVTRALLRGWWAQAETQAQAAGARPALAFREDRGPWLVAVRLADLRPGLGPWPGWEWTATLSLTAWCAVVREGAP